LNITVVDDDTGSENIQKSMIVIENQTNESKAYHSDDESMKSGVLPSLIKSSRSDLSSDKQSRANDDMQIHKKNTLQIPGRNTNDVRLNQNFILYRKSITSQLSDKARVERIRSFVDIDESDKMSDFILVNQNVDNLGLFLSSDRLQKKNSLLHKDNRTISEVVLASRRLSTFSQSRKFSLQKGCSPLNGKNSNLNLPISEPKDVSPFCIYPQNNSERSDIIKPIPMKKFNSINNLKSNIKNQFHMFNEMHDIQSEEDNSQEQNASYRRDEENIVKKYSIV